MNNKRALSPASSDSLRFLAMGDWGAQERQKNQRRLKKDEPDAQFLGAKNNEGYNEDYREEEGDGDYWAVLVAAAMGTYTASYPIDFILALGDNFYNSGVQSTSDELWETVYSDVYSGYSGLNVPWYAIFGNHDHGTDQQAGSLQAQIDYHYVDSNWNAGYCYLQSFTIPNSQTTVDIVFVDTQYIAPEETYMTSTDAGISEDTQAYRQEQQLECLEGYLSASTAGFLLVAGHYPIYSTGRNAPGDVTTLVEYMYPLLETYHVDAYLCGHDHLLQHLQYTTSYGETMDFIISGAAGKPDNQLTSGVTSDATSKFAAATGGFAVAEASTTQLTINMIDYTGTVLYTLTRDRARYGSWAGGATEDGVVSTSKSADVWEHKHYAVLAAKVMTITSMVGLFIVFAVIAFTAGAIVIRRDRVQVCFPVVDNNYNTTVKIPKKKQLQTPGSPNSPIAGKFHPQNVMHTQAEHVQVAVERQKSRMMQNFEESNREERYIDSQLAERPVTHRGQGHTTGLDPNTSMSRGFQERPTRIVRPANLPVNPAMNATNMHSVMEQGKDPEYAMRKVFNQSQPQLVQPSLDGRRPVHPGLHQPSPAFQKAVGKIVASEMANQNAAQAGKKPVKGFSSMSMHGSMHGSRHGGVFDDIDSLVQRQSLSRTGVTPASSSHGSISAQRAPQAGIPPSTTGSSHSTARRAVLTAPQQAMNLSSRPANPSTASMRQAPPDSYPTTVPADRVARSITPVTTFSQARPRPNPAGRPVPSTGAGSNHSQSSPTPAFRKAPLSMSPVSPADGVGIDDIDNLLQRHLQALHRYDEE
eukprot:CAMPEP_0182428496 /NCGR_PEP_ID=MMETSP1167-20130531/23061_1 /TAXON_ID=2988 /ORGANISM="Mallomonas Sp, Strain CCMP3275" /LENGTH=810 /DNA_ID=CAMNT_0024611433 /DNA_START=183 /DNA_END=2615 /DNA_ORIENTATION=-